jgi:RNA polymerase sigma-70 factor (ECF subfamily)
VLAELMPAEPEALALLALMLFCESRRGARRTETGAYVPLSQQDVARWSAPQIAQANALLTNASQRGRLGRFQLEAAIQAVHAQRALCGTTDWHAIVLLYSALLRLAPTIGAAVNHAAALAEAHGAPTALAHLDALPAERIADYQPYWALRAHVLARCGHAAAARDAYDRAIGLCEDGAMRAYLQARMAELD